MKQESSLVAIHKCWYQMLNIRHCMSHIVHILWDNFETWIMHYLWYQNILLKKYRMIDLVLENYRKIPTIDSPYSMEDIAVVQTYICWFIFQYTSSVTVRQSYGDKVLFFFNSLFMISFGNRTNYRCMIYILTYIHTYVRLLLLISMLWHRQAIF